MKIDAKKYALVLFELVQDKSPDESKELISRFVKILAKNHHLALGKKIIYYLNRLYEKAGQDLELSCLSAKPLDKDLLDSLSANFNISKVKTEVDENILGGIILRYQDKIIDASLKTRLNKLNNHLKI